VTGTAGAQSAVEDRVRKGDWDVPFRITRSKTHLYGIALNVAAQLSTLRDRIINTDCDSELRRPVDKVTFLGYVRCHISNY